MGIVTFLSLGFKNEKKSLSPVVQPVEKETTISAFPSNETSIADIPFTKNLFVGFKEAIGHKESRGKYKKVNSFGREISIWCANTSSDWCTKSSSFFKQSSITRKSLYCAFVQKQILVAIGYRETRRNRY